MSTMHVASVVEQCWHKVPGGTARATQSTLEAMQRMGLARLTGVAARHSEPPRLAAPAVNIVHSRLPRPALYEAWHRLGWPRVESMVKAPLDLVHATGGAVPATRLPLVVTIHDLAFLDDPDDFTPRGRSFMTRAWREALSRADRIVCPTEHVAQHCEAEGCDRRRLTVVPWGVSIASDAAPYINPSGPYVLHVGTLEPRKNLKRLLDAMSDVDPALSLISVGPQGWTTDVEAKVAALGERCLLMGNVDNATRDALYRGAEMLCYPSTREGFGLPILEAMALGCPVVTSSGTATEEVGGEAVELVDPYSVTSISAGIERVFGDSVQRAKMIERGQQRAAAFTWERTATELAAVFSDVIGRPR
jgi:glycosyltransferase involved in cell wall biosynthesis